MKAQCNKIKRAKLVNGHKTVVIGPVPEEIAQTFSMLQLTSYATSLFPGTHATVFKEKNKGYLRVHFAPGLL